MKHFIVGTAGHIDHGKTTLIKALTGRETDRLKEEQKRGISIELGFTYFDLPSGKRAGIIDVPGHEKFVKNMLAGVIGIDIVILVVAADEGVMPQTKEHLDILQLLGIKKGFIVLTKIDLVDEEWMELVMEDIKEHVKNTFLENTPIIPVSSIKNIGLDEVRDNIDNLTEEIEERNVKDMPRLPIDRVFTISGFGTIVTGTLISGTFKVGDEVEIFPGNKRGRIRSLQVHDEVADIVEAGQRVAMNIAGLKKSSIDRGNVVAPIDSMKDTMMLDVKVKLLEDIPKIIENRSRVRLYIGTQEILCRIVLLDKEELSPGESAYAQLRLEESTVAKRGDKFILRFYSPMFTIGGGEVLEANPEKKKRFDKQAIEELEIKDKGETEDVIGKVIKDRSKKFPTVKDISIYTAMSEEDVNREIENLKFKNKVITFSLLKDIHVIHIEYFNYLQGKIEEELKKYHIDRPLKQGIGKEEIRSKYFKDIKPRVADEFINLLIKKGIVKQKNEYIFLEGFEIKYNEEQNKIKEEIKKIFIREEFLLPKYEDIVKEIKFDDDEIRQVFESLLDSGEVLKLKEDIYILKDIYERAIAILNEYLDKNGSITVSQYRDLLNTNRKASIALLEYFDEIKITKRVGDKRIFTGKIEENR
ncbi:selenocysteine-specific translation elongation factor [Anaerosalibacter bizertensis]|uniref:selenocysteine-specific translation elongation factor n=1 Tax=Anaerosalibacter bizertensis TaxID=932217 RepID=UPI001C0EE6AA|nr:selenocysteine-specific translation elongation factor [Anaerosalibacter bizertensis]MBU5294037.1 selenocysteine-specific translation elongation factor [Anaerosalibacter bizertensis]